MKEVFNVKINNSNWTIKLVSREFMREKEKLDANEEILGLTEYAILTIYIVYDVDTSIIRNTLIHELTHAWMHEYGHNQHRRQFNNEDVCNIIGAEYDFLEGVVKEYFNGSDK